MRLDKYDWRVVYELDKQSNMPLQKLAKKIGRSKQFVLYRLKRLVDEGIITNCSAIIDMTKLGFFSFRIYLKMKCMTKEQAQEFITFVKTYRQVWTITSMQGTWDYALFLGVKTIPEFHDVWDNITLKYKEHIKKYNTAVYAPIYNFNRTFFLNANQEIITRTYGEGTPVHIDELDWKIIRTYAPNVRASSLELSRLLDVSADTVRARIKKLETKQVICGYKIGLNLAALGYTSYRIDLELSSAKRNKSLFQFCKQHKNIYQVNKSIGNTDYEIEAVVKDQTALLGVIDEIKTQFHDIVDGVEYFSYSTFHVLKYIPD